MQCMHHLNYYWTFLKLSVNLNLHSVRFPTPSDDQRHAKIHSVYHVWNHLSAINHSSMQWLYWWLQNITSKDCPLGCPIICKDIYSQCYFLHRHLKNAWYMPTHWLVRTPYFSIISSDEVSGNVYTVLRRGPDRSQTHLSSATGAGTMACGRFSSTFPGHVVWQSGSMWINHYWWVIYHYDYPD